MFCRCRGTSILFTRIPDISIRVPELYEGDRFVSHFHYCAFQRTLGAQTVRYNTKLKNNNGYSIPHPHGQAMMGCLLTVYCRNLPCYKGSELYIPLYVTVEAPLNPHGAPGNIQGTCITDRCACGCTCVCVCAYEGVPIFCGISIMITDGSLFIWSPGHLQLHCWPSSGSCNHIRWNEWFC